MLTFPSEEELVPFLTDFGTPVVWSRSIWSIGYRVYGLVNFWYAVW